MTQEVQSWENRSHSCPLSILSNTGALFLYGNRGSGLQVDCNIFCCQAANNIAESSPHPSLSLQRTTNRTTNYINLYNYEGSSVMGSSQQNGPLALRLRGAVHYFQEDPTHYEGGGGVVNDTTEVTQIPVYWHCRHIWVLIASSEE